MLEYTLDLESLARELDERLARLELSPMQLQRAGDLIVQLIKERTARGTSLTGRPFVPYAPSTVRARQAQGLGITPDLLHSGKMLASLGATVQAGRVHIAIRDGERAKVAQLLTTGTRHMGARPFIGLTPSERQIVLDYLIDQAKSNL